MTSGGVGSAIGRDKPDPVCAEVLDDLHERKEPPVRDLLAKLRDHAVPVFA